MLKAAPGEEWRDIPGWEGLYQASSEGRVRSLPRLVRNGRYTRLTRCTVLKQGRTTTGYPQVTLYGEGRSATVPVHRLVCSAFHGPPEGKMDVAHADGSRDNNRPDNLRWATRAENMLERTAHGRANTSRSVPEETAREIIARLNRGERQKDIAEALGLKRWTVNAIKRGLSWNQLQHLLRAA